MRSLRENYNFGEIDESALLDDPFAQFNVWFAEAEAAGIREANAMSLATATLSGAPSVRMVLLKGVDHGFVFFTSYDSAKARDLEANPQAALCLHWKEQERQIRATGRVERVSRGESEEYFHLRPRGSQLGAWASHQSAVVPNRLELERQLEAVTSRFGAGEIPVPPFWGGYRIIPHEIEFWQGRENRLHDRIRYKRESGAWTRERLSP